MACRLLTLSLSEHTSIPDFPTFALLVLERIEQLILSILRSSKSQINILPFVDDKPVRHSGSQEPKAKNVYALSSILDTFYPNIKLDA